MSRFAKSVLTIAPDAKAFLASQLGQDRLSTRSELEKLMLFAHGSGRNSPRSCRGHCAATHRAFSLRRPSMRLSEAISRRSMRACADFGGASDHSCAARRGLRLPRICGCTATQFWRGHAKHPVSPEAFAEMPSIGISPGRKARLRPGDRDPWPRRSPGTSREPKLGACLDGRALWTIALSARKTAAR